LPFASAVVVALAAPLRVIAAPEVVFDGLRVPERLAVTESAKEPLIDPCVAEIVVWPTAMPVATPLALTLAAAGFDELHVTELVTVWVLPSL